jgi:tripartite-type tricarboxylate transporter receptor subunit TctC
MTDVPYKNVGQAMTDTISGTADFYFPAFPTALSHLRSGKVNVLAVGADQRLPAAPDVPTFAEALNKPGYAPAAWFGIVAPKGTPQDIVRKLSAEMQHAVQSTQVRERIEKLGAQITFLPADEFGKALQAETDKWAKVIKPLGLRTQ